MITSAAENIRAELEREFPAWLVWIVWHAVGGQTWCARREGEDTAALNAPGPGELAELLRSAGQGP